MKKILLDAREMPHPEPLQHALSYLQKMSNEEYLYMLNRKKPIPLIEVAKEKVFAHHSYEDRPNSCWHILICKDIDCNLEELLDV